MLFAVLIILAVSSLFYLLVFGPLMIAICGYLLKKTKVQSSKIRAYTVLISTIILSPIPFKSDDAMTMPFPLVLAVAELFSTKSLYETTGLDIQMVLLMAPILFVWALLVIYFLSFTFLKEKDLQ